MLESIYAGISITTREIGLPIKELPVLEVPIAVKHRWTITVRITFGRKEMRSWSYDVAA